MSVNSLSTMTINTLQFIAPLCGGAIILVFGPKIVLAIDMLSFIISAITILFVQIPKHEKLINEVITVKKLIENIKAGFIVIKKSQKLSIIMITTAITMFGQGFISPLWLPYVIEVLNQPMEKFAYLVSFQGFGSIVGSVLTMLLGIKSIKSPELLYSIFTLGVGITIFMQITTVNYSIFIIWGTLVGVFLSGYGVTTQTIIQHSTDKEFMGRVSSTFMIVNQGFMLLAVMIAGVFSDVLSTRILFVIACSFWLFGCIIGAFLMHFRKGE